LIQQKEEPSWKEST